MDAPGAVLGAVGAVGQRPAQAFVLRRDGGIQPIGQRLHPVGEQQHALAAAARAEGERDGAHQQRPGEGGGQRDQQR